MDKETFAGEIAELIQRSSPILIQINLDRQRFTLQVSSEGHFVKEVNLNGYFDEYDSSAGELSLEAIVARVNQTFPPIFSYEEAKSRLYPHFMSRWKVEELNLLCKLGRYGEAGFVSSIPYATIAEDFAVPVVYDYHTSRRIITNGYYESWEIDIEPVFRNAVQNIRERTNNEWKVLTDKSSEVWFSTWNDSYDPARVLLPEAIRAVEIKGRPIVFLLNAEAIAVVGEDDLPGQLVALGMLEQEQSGQKPLPPLPLTLADNNSLVRYTPRPSPISNHYHQLAYIYFLKTYQAQKELLKSLYEPQDIFCAKYVALKSEDGSFYSTCTLSEGVPSILPKADTIAFMRVHATKAELVAECAFDKALEVMGPQMENLQMYPPVYAVKDFPDARQLAALGRS